MDQPEVNQNRNAKPRIPPNLLLGLIDAISLKFPNHIDEVSFPLKTATEEEIARLREKLPTVNEDLCDFLQLINGDGVERLLPPIRFDGVCLLYTSDAADE